MKTDCPEILRLIDLALEEDRALQDRTSTSVIPPDALANAEIISKAEGVLAGLEVAAQVFLRIDPGVSFEAIKQDGEAVFPGECLARISGRARSILAGERTSLNFIQHLSGIATYASQLAALVRGKGVRILDTRKTVPGMRLLQKYAVSVGGAVNHRMNLEDGILIKNNHLMFCSISEAVARAKKNSPPQMPTEVEVETLEQLEEALSAGADIIMLDNMDKGLMQKAVQITAGRARLEASGDMTPAKIKAICDLGIDDISVGGLTHSVRALNMSLRVIPQVPSAPEK
ncbi:MAG: carboxylating nicotinate-nucleotide diphosphorylase [bacterium]